MQRNTKDTADTREQTADEGMHHSPEVSSDDRPAKGPRPVERGEQGDQAAPMKSADITSKTVLSITSGARLGQVAGVLFDPTSLDLAALRISAHGQQAVVPFD